MFVNGKVGDTRYDGEGARFDSHRGESIGGELGVDWRRGDGRFGRYPLHPAHDSAIMRLRATMLQRREIWRAEYVGYSAVVMY